MKKAVLNAHLLKRYRTVLRCAGKRVDDINNSTYYKGFLSPLVQIQISLLGTPASAVST